MTRQRQLVFTIIQEAKTHPTPEEIFLSAKEKMPSIVLSTVYNNLNALCAQGLIRRIKLNGQPDRFDKTLLPHEHVVCDSCGAVADVKDLGDLKEELQSRTGLPLTDYELNLHYTCPQCRKKKLSQGDAVSKI